MVCDSFQRVGSTLGWLYPPFSPKRGRVFYCLETVLDRNWFLSVVTGLDDEVLGRVAEQLGNKFFRAGLLLGIPPHDLDTIQVCVLFIYMLSIPVVSIA